MTREEFKERYVKESGITEEFFDTHFQVERCDCGDSHCEGWAAISKRQWMFERNSERKESGWHG